MDEFLALPLTLRNGYFQRCDVEQSIRQSVALIIATRKGMIPFAPDYGSDLWEKEFSDLYVTRSSELRSALRNAIGQLETRLYNVTVSLVQQKSGSDDPAADSLAVRVSGNYKHGTEEHKFESMFSLTN